MYSFYYKGLRLGVTFQVKHLCVGDFASFAKIFAGFYFGRGIVINDPNLRLSLGNDMVWDGGTYRKNVGAISKSSRESAEVLPNLEQDEEILWID